MIGWLLDCFVCRQGTKGIGRLSVGLFCFSSRNQGELIGWLWHCSVFRFPARGPSAARGRWGAPPHGTLHAMVGRVLAGMASPSPMMVSMIDGGGGGGGGGGNHDGRW